MHTYNTRFNSKIDIKASINVQNMMKIIPFNKSRIVIKSAMVASMLEVFFAFMSSIVYACDVQ